MILRTVDWDLRYNMRRKYGFAAGIVYAQPMDGDYEPAGWNRTRVKLWAHGLATLRRYCAARSIYPQAVNGLLAGPARTNTL